MLCFNKDNISSDYNSFGFCTDHQNADSYLNHSLGGIITLRGTEKIQLIVSNGTEYMRQSVNGRGRRDLCQNNRDD